MTTRNVQEFCERLWEAREECRLPSAPVISRGMAMAVAADVTACEDYEPHVDLRLVWVQAIVKGRLWLKHDSQPEAPAPVEATVAYLLGKEFPAPVLTGKELAAGEREANSECLSPGSNLDEFQRKFDAEQVAVVSVMSPTLVGRLVVNGMLGGEA